MVQPDVNNYSSKKPEVTNFVSQTCHLNEFPFSFNDHPKTTEYGYVFYWVS